jgi:Tfp pilus assembly protein PilF
MVLQRISYNDFAKIAYEEGIHVNPGNRALLKNYLLFLLEVKQFDKFQTVLIHAKRVLDAAEISQL